MKVASTSGTHRSSARFSFVSDAESTIHHMPRICTNERPISKAAKFLVGLGRILSNAIINPLRNWQARRRSLMVRESSASCINVRPARISTSAKTTPSNFGGSLHQSKIFLDFGEPTTVYAGGDDLGDEP